MAKVSLIATCAALALVAGACSDMGSSQDQASQQQSQADTPFYTQMPKAPANQNPSLSQAPSPMTDESDPNNTPINP
jgi:hypothetical protein